MGSKSDKFKLGEFNLVYIYKEIKAQRIASCSLL